MRLRRGIERRQQEPRLLQSVRESKNRGQEPGLIAGQVESVSTKGRGGRGQESLAQSVEGIR